MGLAPVDKYSLETRYRGPTALLVEAENILARVVMALSLPVRFDRGPKMVLRCRETGITFTLSYTLLFFFVVMPTRMSI